MNLRTICLILIGTILMTALVKIVLALLTSSYDTIDDEFEKIEEHMPEREAIACCNGLFDYAAEEDGEWIAWAVRGEWREEFGIYCDPGCCGYRTGKTKLDAIQNLARWLRDEPSSSRSR